MKKPISYLLLILSIPIIFSACKKDEDDDNSGDGIALNIFSIEDDKEMGAQMDAYLRDSIGHLFLERSEYPEAYAYIDGLKNQILKSNSIKHKDDFEWKVTIIKDDATLNAFATPGGYIFVYTGLMKYLDCGDHFAGVLGHEMAHSDRRHSTKQMTKQYGTGVLLGALLGDGTISQLTKGLIGLKFSRSDESEADEYSVKYLCTVPDIASDGAAGFFQKLITEGHAGGTPQFLSTHPNPDNRVEAIKAKAKDCDITETCSNEYTQVINSLP